MTDQTPAADIVERLRALMAAATPGPYRAHDHNDMMRVGGNPTEWIGYGWVGRITKSSGPNGEFDSGWLSADRRKDGSKEYRERASVDVHFVAEALNALPSLLDEIEALRAREAELQATLAERNDQLHVALASRHELQRKLDEAQADKARLDYLDECNRRLNARYGTKYGWKLVLNHNVNRLMLGHLDVDLHDSEGSVAKLPSCRAAIDERMLSSIRGEG